MVVPVEQPLVERCLQSPLFGTVMLDRQPKLQTQIGFTFSQLRVHNNPSY
jgi:hypothetical protein